MTTSTSPAHLTVRKVAERWGRDIKQIYAVINSGELPAIRFGPKSIRIRLEDVEAYEAAHCTAPLPPPDPELAEYCRQLVGPNPPPLSEGQRERIRAAFKSAT